MEENILKQKYNELLARYKKGSEYLVEHPENAEKTNAELNKIEAELSKIIEALPDMTDEERTEGFKLDNEQAEVQTEQATEQVSEQVSEQVEQKAIAVKPKSKKIAVPIVQEEDIIETSSGNIKLTPEIVRKYLVNGQGNVNDQEVAMFIGMCKANRLNPFNKEAYLIKYSSEPATIVTSKDIFFKRANQNPNYDGMESGIIVINNDKKIEKRIGHIYIDGEKIVGAWCKVYRKDWSHPIYQEVNMSEYEGRKKSGELNSNWKTKPAVMITKVAEATALRKAFTENLQGMFLVEETDDVVSEPVKQAPIDILD